MIARNMAALPFSTKRGVPNLLTQTWALSIAQKQSDHFSSSRSITALPSLISQTHRKQRWSDITSPYTNMGRSFHSTTARTLTNQTNRPSAIPHISLHIAASSNGKGRKFQPEKSTFDFRPDKDGPLGLQKEGSIYQKRRARADSGQDAYFVAHVGDNSNSTAFGVADGVGGWTDQGVDPADFSHGLCSYMVETASNWPKTRTSSGPEKLGPRQLLEHGYEATLKDPQIRAGGTTACVVVVDEDGRMRIANLGDSGYLLLRLGTVHHYSNPQTHAFNTPFQMSITPPEILTQAAIFGGLPLNDLPERADMADHMLRHGDVLVLGTDGVWDNLSSQDILHSVSKIMREVGAWERTDDKGFVVTEALEGLIKGGGDKSAAETKLQQTLQAHIASSIVRDAKTASLDSKRDGPFAKAVQKEYPMERFHGGKVDDITVLTVIPFQSGGIEADEGPAKAKL